MSGKAPAFQFYPNDWVHDLEEHPLEIEGAWIRICCKLWWSETRGMASKTITQWSRILRVTEEQTNYILNYLEKEKIADIKYHTGNAEVTDGNKIVTVISRRMYREYKEMDNNRLRQRKYKEKHKCNKKVTPLSSSSTSSSTSKRDIKKEISFKEMFDKIKPELDPVDVKLFERQFIDYWTEKNSNGKRERWQKEKTFDIKRRFHTWVENDYKKLKENYLRDNKQQSSSAADHGYKDASEVIKNAKQQGGM